MLGTRSRPAARGRANALKVAYTARLPAGRPATSTFVLADTGPGREAEAMRTAASRPAEGKVRAGRRVLHPTDYTDASRAAFEVACDLGGAGGRVTVLHVADPPYVPLGMAKPPPRRPGYRGAWDAQLRMVQPSDPAVGIDHRLAEGRPAAEILRAAGSHPWDLVVLGARRRGWVRRAVGGSVSRTVARKAGCPVATLTVPANWPPTLRSRDVLYATDHPEPDASSFTLARDLTEARAGELTVLYVPPRLWARQGRRAEEQWRRLVARVPGCRFLVRRGPTADAVLRTGSAVRAGLVVMPAWCGLGLRDLFDPAAAVRNIAPCPVLTVHPARGNGTGRPATPDRRPNSFDPVFIRTEVDHAT